MFDTKLYEAEPIANEKAVIQGEKYRITVLTDRLFRIEYSEEGKFEDRATKLVLNRKFPVPDYKLERTEKGIEIDTGACHLVYDEKEFSCGGLYCFVKGSPVHKADKWFYGIDFSKTLGVMHKNYKGTFKTLDQADGEVELDDGMIAGIGFTTLDDSDTMYLDKGWFYKDKEYKHEDFYLFGHGNKFEQCISDFYKLTGKCPMIPRYALGNWWSRYHEYTEQSYLELMEKFEKKNVPLSVAVIDMDWHWVNIDESWGNNGWTGYSWNTDLFPDPKRFLSKLHDKKLAVTLNLHPSDGVRYYEDSYKDYAEYMGIDPESKETVQFNVASEKSMTGLFEKVLHPMEDMGVDFWWIDWQQEGGTTDADYDTLWMLNHTFYLDNARKGKYPLAFSRYAGVGSHRYPIGFSGDTIMTWESLDFQPYFTSTAANIGYSWWSHDIGGHFHGKWSDELQVRWTQYGVFSPIMRLHSNNNPFMLKEPWNFNIREETILEDNMRLRHKLIPYLYTMNYRNAEQGIPLVVPMYHKYPYVPEAKNYQNEYFFGTSFLVCPITSKNDEETQLGRVAAWLPKGTWIDFFSNRVYEGDRTLDLYRPLETYPVLVKAGAVIPMASEKSLSNGTDMPKDMDIEVYIGDDGQFEMYEDNGRLFKAHKQATTLYTFKNGEKCVFTVEKAQGDIAILPKKRNYTFKFNAVSVCDDIEVKVNGKKAQFQSEYDAEKRTLSVSVEKITPADKVTVTFKCDGKPCSCNRKDDIFAIVARFQCENDLKQSIFNTFRKHTDIPTIITEIMRQTKNTYITGAITERLTNF